MLEGKVSGKVTTIKLNSLRIKKASIRLSGLNLYSFPKLIEVVNHQRAH